MLRRPSYSFIQLTQDSLKELLLQSIKQKSRAIELYNNLINHSPDEFSTSLLSNTQASELRMMNRLQNQYKQTFGPIPDYYIEPSDVAFPSLLDGILLALSYNNQAMAFEREALDNIGAEGLGFQLYLYLLLNDMGQQDLLNTLYTYYLHQSRLGAEQ